ncbi:Nif11-like leader peptide family natural product precursor [Allocoleopsis sp.]|uniref:Nif11-like leader peptide family natural product precursor n=1 Tax=Allocoleopsis sp. TaxID=3088169 RepID=UPI002FD51E07
MSRENLERFLQVVLETPALQEQIVSAPDQDSVVRLAVQLGEENGYSFTTEEVVEEIQRYAQQQNIEVRFPLTDIVATPVTY